MNPLKIDLVINNIFQYLPLGEIAKFRAVSRQWLDVGSRVIVSRIKELVMLFVANEEVGTAFVDWFFMMHKNCLFEFNNFKFLRFPMGDIKTKQLLKACGSALRTLTLTNVLITSSQLADLLANQAPFVEELTLINLPNDVKQNRIFSSQSKPSLELKHLVLDGDLNYSHAFLKDLFSASRKLESLAMTTNFDSQYREYKILETLIKDGLTENLQKLKLSSVDDRVFNLLETHLKSAPLKVLIVGYQGYGSASHITTNSFQTFVNEHKDKWEHLEISISQWEATLQFPEMMNLKFFSFGSHYPLHGNDVSPSFGIFDYGKLFPNLVTLNLYEMGSWDHGKWDFGVQRLFNLNELFPESSTSLPTLKNLELPQQLNRDILRRVGKIFPNVCKLNLSCQPLEVFIELWTTWPLIKTLAISMFDPDLKYGANKSKPIRQSYDSTFTGISDDLLQILKNSDTEVDQSMITGPSISNLKQLRHLIISDGPRLGTWQNWTPPSNITDATFRFALNDLTELVCLHISHGIHKVSKSCLKETCSKLELLDTGCEIATHMVKYQWQQDAWKQIDLYLFRSFPHF